MIEDTETAPGKLIVIEGLDGSGKSTQLALLPDILAENGITVRSISFPDYDDPSSTLVKMYLNGEMGESTDDVNAFAASIFYAADRYASFKRHWGEYYNAGGIVLSGRYVSSNAAHQMSKLPDNQWPDYLDWLYDLEYNRIGIPKPDLVVFLDMPLDISKALLHKRYGGDNTKLDLHEQNDDYLASCRKSALFAAEYSGWKVILCGEKGQPYPVENISGEICKLIISELK